MASLYKQINPFPTQNSTESAGRALEESFTFEGGRGRCVQPIERSPFLPQYLWKDFGRMRANASFLSSSRSPAIRQQFFE